MDCNAIEPRSLVAGPYRGRRRRCRAPGQVGESPLARPEWRGGRDGQEPRSDRQVAENAAIVPQRVSSNHGRAEPSPRIGELATSRFTGHESAIDSPVARSATDAPDIAGLTTGLTSLEQF